LINFIIGCKLKIIDIFDGDFSVCFDIFLGDEFVSDELLEFFDSGGSENKFVFIFERNVVWRVELDEIGFGCFGLHWR
jgi:hypothetical protein